MSLKGMFDKVEVPAIGQARVVYLLGPGPTPKDLAEELNHKRKRDYYYHVQKIRRRKLRAIRLLKELRDAEKLAHHHNRA